MLTFLAQTTSPAVTEALPNLGIAWRLAIFAIIGAMTAVQQDLRTFRDARRTNPTARFDWGLALTQLASGAITGLVIGSGMNATAGLVGQ